MSKTPVKNALVVSVPALLSQGEIAARYRVLLENDKELAIAIAAQTLASNATKGTARRGNVPSHVESETERCLRIAHFSAADNRGKIFAFALSRLGESNEVSLAENEIAKAIGVSQDKVYGPLKICERRINDRTPEGLARFPLLPTLGYEAAIDGSRGAEKVFILSRVAPKKGSKVSLRGKQGKIARELEASTNARKPADTVETDTNTTTS